jgi:uncharacterized protein (DUF1778 family)
MARLTLRLPSSLHDQLVALAKAEGVSLNQYIVYSLSRQAASASAIEEMPGFRVAERRVDYGTRIGDSELTPELIHRLKELIARQDGT